MRKVYHLSTCDTCKRIIRALDLPQGFSYQDIKKEELTVKQLEELKELAGSYEALFSKRAKLYKERNLKHEDLKERDFKQLLLEHYTFLKRPVIINGKDIFIGNSPKTVDAAKRSVKNN
jgi:arsenate reductase